MRGWRQASATHHPHSISEVHLTILLPYQKRCDMKLLTTSGFSWSALPTSPAYVTVVSTSRPPLAPPVCHLIIPVDLSYAATSPDDIMLTSPDLDPTQWCHADVIQKKRQSPEKSIFWPKCCVFCTFCKKSYCILCMKFTSEPSPACWIFPGDRWRAISTCIRDHCSQSTRYLSSWNPHVPGFVRKSPKIA